MSSTSHRPALCPQHATKRFFPPLTTHRKIADTPRRSPISRSHGESIRERSSQVNIKRIAAAFFAAVLLATWAWADGEEVGAGADAKQLDERIYKVLRDVINTGAERYNKPNNDP